MIVEFDKSFYKSLEKIRDKSLFPRIERSIINLEKAKSLADIPNLKKLAGFNEYYRVRIGDYKLGFEKLSNTTIRLIIIANRKDIYKLFP
jgi:mRNA interferase RelE/StbE